MNTVCIVQQHRFQQEIRITTRLWVGHELKLALQGEMSRHMKETENQNSVAC